ncbi:C-type lectin-like [Branchiostoma floridae x Branchiostoma japonicum]
MPYGKHLFISAGCPKADYVHFNGVCYKSFAEQKTRDEAKQTCASDGGILAIPKDNATNTFLANLAEVVGGRWLGLIRANSDEQWVFEDGQTLTSSNYSNWYPGEPEPFDCVGYWATESFWDAKACWKLKGFICQLYEASTTAVQTTTPPPTTPTTTTNQGNFRK